MVLWLHTFSLPKCNLLQIFVRELGIERAKGYGMREGEPEKGDGINVTMRWNDVSQVKEES